MLFNEMQTFHVLLHLSQHVETYLHPARREKKHLPSPASAAVHQPGSSNTCLSTTCSHCEECHELCRAFFRAQGILSRILYLGSASRCWSPCTSCPPPSPWPRYALARPSGCFEVPGFSLLISWLTVLNGIIFYFDLFAL